MIGRVLRIALWLVVGEAILAALYWVFLTTPESNTIMLAASVLLLLALILGSGVVLGAAILGSTGAGMSRAVRGAPWIVAAVLPPLLLWWLVTMADVWVLAHAGEIAAWFIATLGWADVSWLMRASDWLSLWLRGVVAPLLGVSLFAALLFRGAGALGRLSWVSRALRFSTLIVSTVAFAILIVLPFQAAFWQPRGLPSNWIEPTLAGLRLLAIGVVINIGWAIMIAMVAERAAVEPMPRTEPIPRPTPGPDHAGTVSLD